MSESERGGVTIAVPRRRALYSVLSADQRRFMFWHAIVGAAIVNAILNALIAWLSGPRSRSCAGSLTAPSSAEPPSVRSAPPRSGRLPLR
jgi:hypothetical protein